MSYEVTRLNLRQSQGIIEKYHRHSKPLKRHIFSIGAIKNSHCVGVLTVGRPSSALTRYRSYIEIKRVCVMGEHKNAASFLIGHACNACFSMGYSTILSYTQPWESGSSLLGSGFKIKKVAATSIYKDGRVEGGLVSWVKHLNSQTKKEDRERSKRWLAEVHEFLGGEIMEAHKQ